MGEHFYKNISRERLVVIAKFAEQCERSDEMKDIMMQVVNMNPVLNVEERNLLSAAFRNAVGQRRAASRIVNNLETQDNSKSYGKDYLSDAKAYREFIEKELLAVCHECLDVVQNKLITDSLSREDSVFYHKMIADYNRYMAEPSDVTQRDEYAQAAHKAYQLAVEKAEGLTPSNPIKLGLFLNYSVFYYEILNKKQEACKMAHEAFNASVSELDSISEECYKDSTLIMQLLRDNMTLWTADGDDVSDEL